MKEHNREIIVNKKNKKRKNLWNKRNFAQIFKYEIFTRDESRDID